MPSGIRLPRDPSGGQRRLYTIRGTVSSHGEKSLGWWIFKKRIPVLEISLNSDQVNIFNCLARESMSVDEGGNLGGVAQVLEIGVAPDEFEEFPVGADVGVVFGYAGPIEQFFNGRDPLAVVDIKVITATTVLTNEVPRATA